MCLDFDNGWCGHMSIVDDVNHELDRRYDERLQREAQERRNTPEYREWERRVSYLRGEQPKTRKTDR